MKYVFPRTRKNEGKHCIWQFLKQIEIHKDRVTRKERKDDITKSLH